MHMDDKHLVKFNRVRSSIKEALNELNNFSKTENFQIISKSLEETLEKLETENFKVVVVGEFSRGKSTFINALLGRDVLPSSALPTTATINSLNILTLITPICIISMKNRP